MFKNSLFLAAGGLAIAATPAVAQDADTTYNGPYVSGFAGYDAIELGSGEFLVFDVEQDGVFGGPVRTATGRNAFSPGFCDGAALGNSPAQGCANDEDDLVFGGRIGYDARRPGSNFVVGVLVEGHSSNAVDFTSGFSSTPASYTTIRELDYAISARGRVGLTAGDGRGLFYVTGGVSYAKIDHDFVSTNTANEFSLSNDDDMVLGAQLGGGAEVMVTRNIGLGLEYLYSSYDDDEAFVNVDAGTAGPTNPFLLVSGGTDLRPSNTDFRMHSFRGTVSFHF